MLAARLLKPFLRIRDCQAVTERSLRTPAFSSMVTPVPTLGKLDASRSALMLCDIQERFRENIHKMDSVIDGAVRMTRGAAALNMPVLVTEQYPKALGSTVAELSEVLPEGSLVVPKTKFSMSVDEITERLQKTPDVKQLLLAGLETHVCILQTTLDMIDQGYEVHIITDACSSQRPGDRSVALHRLVQAGALLSTQEMALFQLAGHSKCPLVLIAGMQHPAFKAISALAKEARPESSL